MLMSIINLLDYENEIVIYYENYYAWECMCTEKLIHKIYLKFIQSFGINSMFVNLIDYSVMLSWIY